MTLSDIANIRLISQRIEGTDFRTAKEIVSWMGAMQAQDYAMAKWAIGTRLLNATGASVEDAIDKGEVIRTHVMRPTWHFVTAEDIYWMLELTAPQIKSSMKSRHTGLELTKEVVAQGNKLIENVIAKEKNVTREQIAKVFENSNIRTDDNRLAHFLILAELDGIICSGQIIDNKPSYALLNERVPHKKNLTREESLAELAKRYFKSHCPATINDFAWWSGLPFKDVRQGLELVKKDFVFEAYGDQKYWMTPSFTTFRRDKQSIHLLPAYDEFLIGYRDRSAALTVIDKNKTVSVNGIFYPIIITDGQVAGLSKKKTVKDKMMIEIILFRESNHGFESLIGKEVSDYGRFLNKATEIGNYHLW
jgi:hypothetical protein